MNKVKVAAVAALLATISVSTYADEKMLEMATQKGCFICHSLQKKEGPAIPLAPAYTDIAERYKDGKFSVEALAQRIQAGTVNTPQNWEGKVNMRFMPPNVNVSAEEAKQLAQWVLSVKPDTVSEKFVTQEGMLALAAQNGCVACHGIDKEKDSHYIPLAPTYRMISERYKNNPEAKKLLVESILHGTGSKTEHWADVNMRFMPPNPSLKQEEAEKIVDWILTL